jgi:hemerythrin-like metal-binding protein
MKIIQWDDAYDVGLKEIDDQHKRLLDIINSIICEQQDKYDTTKFKSSLSTMIHYAYTHFATEERILIQTEYPDLERHVLEHIDFIIKTLGLALDIDRGKGENRKELLRYLKEWFSTHVLGIDREYIPFLKLKESE